VPLEGFCGAHENFNISLYISFIDLFNDVLCNWYYTASKDRLIDKLDRIRKEAGMAYF
jgi:hypothetical protein